ncbi:Uncharacterized protein TCM_030429 [Theobroma cacao]|uniref:Uncharacterized protein n=1 Tax=Theobroma cacao TaxID=3641 RepID=A0A061GHS6_THECC|nr:Uncharacterized protein TCM_030429 [Theobroma cacao]
MVLKVDLQCYRCYKKVKKVLCKFPEIRDQKYDDKANTVTISVVSRNPESIRSKICDKAGCCIKSIEIKPKDKPGTDKGYFVRNAICGIEKGRARRVRVFHSDSHAMRIVGKEFGVVGVAVVGAKAAQVMGGSAGIVAIVAASLVKGVAALPVADATACLGLVVGTATGTVKVAAALLATADLAVGATTGRVKGAAAHPVAGATAGLVVDTVAGLVKGAAALLAAAATAGLVVDTVAGLVKGAAALLAAAATAGHASGAVTFPAVVVVDVLAVGAQAVL